MAETTDLRRRKPRRLSETVYTDSGSRLAPYPRAGRRKSLPAAVTLVSVCAIGPLLWLLLGSGLSAESQGPRYMSSTSVWVNDPESIASPREGEVYYAGCNDVRAAGAAPLYSTQPGYRSDMDGDGDGIACEPHHAP